jgi:hypothetical protein
MCPSNSTSTQVAKLLSLPIPRRASSNKFIIGPVEYTDVDSNSVASYNHQRFCSHCECADEPDGVDLSPEIGQLLAAKHDFDALFFTCVKSVSREFVEAIGEVTTTVLSVSFIKQGVFPLDVPFPGMVKELRLIDIPGMSELPPLNYPHMTSFVLNFCGNVRYSIHNTPRSPIIGQCP